MHILKGIKIVDLALCIGNSLIIADTHIGYEEAINKQGVLIPRFQFDKIIKRLERIFKQLNAGKSNKLKKIIINGDIKHEFGVISETEWRHTIRLLDFLLQYCEEIILIKGNHDTILGPIAKKRNIKIVDYLSIDDNLIMHGDKLADKLNIDKKLFKRINTIIIGHEHPAVSIRENARAELFKCFLLGKYKGKNLIVQPSFNLVTEGSDVLKDKLLSPFLKQDLSDFEVYVVADKVYKFGRIKNLS